MNRRTLWVFLVPVLIAIALGPTVTTVATGLRESRVLVSATPLLDAPAQDVRLADTPPMVDSQWQWTSGWRARAENNQYIMTYDAARGASLVGDAWQYEASTPPSGAGPFRDQAA